jgi:hypothetical protein
MVMATTRLIQLTGAQKGQELALREGSNFLGRALTNDVVLDDPGVSGRHCEVVVTELNVRVRDLGSTNGTWLDSRRVLETEARHGQILTLGGLDLRVMVATAEISIPALPVSSEPAPSALADGRPACLLHPDVPATLRCVQCGRAYCGDCVSELRLVGREVRAFCPTCSGACVPLAGTTRAGRPKAFARRLLERFGLGGKRGEPAP